MKKKATQDTKKKKKSESKKRAILNKTLKRKKAAIKTAVTKSKKAKLLKEKPTVQDSEEDSEDDEEESTPISQLKAQMAASKEIEAKKRVQHMSPLAKNLMHKLKQVSNEVLSKPGAKKRKLGADKDDDVPLKKLQVLS